MVVAESPNIVYHLTAAFGIGLLILLYFFGVWSRSYVLPTANDLPVRKQFIASVPVGFVTMGLYAKTAFAGLSLASTNLTFDCATMVGYAIIFGMLSRESLERMMKAASPPEPAPANPQGVQ
ncbi:MAG: hypothetical protein QOJ96_3525 [Alphaproteobacteria bacterium]|jgi:hypothetical protein|nr:hypothetical protein [Alphaproteobacteria bacterium]